MLIWVNNANTIVIKHLSKTIVETLFLTLSIPWITAHEEIVFCGALEKREKYLYSQSGYAITFCSNEFQKGLSIMNY